MMFYDRYCLLNTNIVYKKSIPRLNFYKNVLKYIYALIRIIQSRPYSHLIFGINCLIWSNLIKRSNFLYACVTVDTLIICSILLTYLIPYSKLRHLKMQVKRLLLHRQHHLTPTDFKQHLIYWYSLYDISAQRNTVIIFLYLAKFTCHKYILFIVRKISLWINQQIEFYILYELKLFCSLQWSSPSSLVYLYRQA